MTFYIFTKESWMKQHRSTRYHFQIVIYLRGINRDNLNTFKINPVHLDFVAFSKTFVIFIGLCMAVYIKWWTSVSIRVLKWKSVKFFFKLNSINLIIYKAINRKVEKNICPHDLNEIIYSFNPNNLLWSSVYF